MQPVTLTRNINKLEQLYVHLRLPEISLIWIVHFQGYKYMAVDFGQKCTFCQKCNFCFPLQKLRVIVFIKLNSGGLGACSLEKTFL